MRIVVPIAEMTLVACMSAWAVQLCSDEPITPLVELQSRPLTPGLALAECSQHRSPWIFY